MAGISYSGLLRGRSGTPLMNTNGIASGPSHVLRFLGFIGPLDVFHLFYNFLKRNTSLHDGVLLQIGGAELSPGLGVNGLEPSFFLAQRPLPRLVRFSFRHGFLLVPINVGIVPVELAGCNYLSSPLSLTVGALTAS